MLQTWLKFQPTPDTSNLPPVVETSRTPPECLSAMQTEFADVSRIDRVADCPSEHLHKRPERSTKHEICQGQKKVQKLNALNGFLLGSLGQPLNTEQANR